MIMECFFLFFQNTILPDFYSINLLTHSTSLGSEGFFVCLFISIPNISYCGDFDVFPIEEVALPLIF